MKKHTIKFISFLLLILLVSTLSSCFKIGNWKEIKNGFLVFEYPNEFEKVEFDKEDNVDFTRFLTHSSYQMYSDMEEDVLTMNMIYDFDDIDTMPRPEVILYGSIMNTLREVGGIDIEMFDTVTEDNKISTKFEYKIGDKEFEGYGVVGFKKTRCEVALFVPQKKKMSEKHLNRLIDSVRIDMEEMNRLFPWHRFNGRNLSFDYPNMLENVSKDINQKLSEREYSEADKQSIDNVSVEVYTDQRSDVFTMFYKMKFSDLATKPQPNESFSGSVAGALLKMGAKNIEWVDTHTGDDIISSKVKYTINDVPREGFAFLYFEEDYYELVIILPFSRDVSKEEMRRIIDSFEVKKDIDF